MAAEHPPLPGPDATKDHLYDVARRLRVRGRSTMSRAELVAAIEEARRTAAPPERTPPTG